MSVTELISDLHLKDSVTITLNSQFLNHNFQIVKQCLLKIKDLQAMVDKSSGFTDNLEFQLKELQVRVGENSSKIAENAGKIKELDSNVGDQFMNKMYGIEQKTKNMFDFDETVRRIEELEKFVPMKTFQQNRIEIGKEIASVWNLKQQFERYLQHTDFQDYKREQNQQLLQKQEALELTNCQIAKLGGKVGDLEGGLGKLNEQLTQNNRMIREINLVEMVEKMSRVKEENEAKLAQFVVKLKKKVGINDLFSFEKMMIEKLDSILGDSEKNKAEKIETKNALVFLQKKISELEMYIIQKLPEEEQDGLFTSKKWQCASCSKDLGKYEGKLGQYRPWSIFPCKEPETEKSGGLGYLNYIDKVAYKRGYDLEDQSMDRLNKTFNDSKQTPRKLNSTRASNLISTFGSDDKRSSLKDAYYRDISSEKGERAKQFRVLKKQAAKVIGEEGKPLEKEMG